MTRDPSSKTALWTRRRILSLLSPVALLAGIVLPGFGPAGTAHAAGATYYVDSVGGSDSNSGTSSASPWKSLSKVNATTFHGGDHILFKAGDTWTGQLNPKGSGLSGSPIVVDMYGSGNKPKFQGNGTVHNTVYFEDQQYWELNNLEVTNDAGSSASNLGDYRGIHFYATDAGTLNHFVLNHLYVHNVTGNVAWVGGSGPAGTGIRYNAGWDDAKDTGGIVFNTGTNNPSNPTVSQFNDVVIENSAIEDTSFGAIVFKQYAGTDSGDKFVGWGERASTGDSNWKPFTNVTVQNNYISQYNTSYGCNGMLLADIRGGVVQGNVLAGVGTSGIEFDYADNVTVQKNEVYDTVRKAGGGDYNAIDPDRGATNIIIQYNYVHNNGDGILLCETCGGYGGDAIVRYNIIDSNSHYQFYMASGSGSTNQIYNNTIYNDSSSYLTQGNNSGYYYFWNNIFDSTRSAVFTTGGRVVYSYNSYRNVSVPSSDTHAITSDPRLVAPGTGGTGTQSSGPALNTLGGYQLQSGSPDIDSGMSISSNGGVDFWGNTLYQGSPDRGANEYSGSGTGGGGGGSGYVRFQNHATGLFIDGMGLTSNGSNAGQYSSSTSYNQQWQIVADGSYVRLQNRATGLFLDGEGRTSNGSAVGQWSDSTSNNQQWTETTTNGYVRFQNRATGLFIDGEGRTANGSDLGQWSSSTSSNQQWSVISS